MANRAEDRYQEYYAEKLWSMIPAIYRHEDGLAENPGVLRAIVEIMAEQAAILRRSHDRLWEDQYIELSDEWAVPYLADLVRTRLVSALNKRGRRVDTAKTIYYRRRKGTVRVLEELVSDIAGWEGKVVENFCLLARPRHNLDPRPRPFAGRFSGTMPGGVADLRRPFAAELAGGPFDEYHYTPDVRRHKGQNGRYNISKIAFHLYRLPALPVSGVTPFARPDGVSFTFDPSGRGDSPLFARRNRPEQTDADGRQIQLWDEWRSIELWELPAPIPCRLLGHADYLITEAIVQQLLAGGLSAAAAAELRTMAGHRIQGEARLRTTLSLLANSADFLAPAAYQTILGGSLVDDCGQAALLPESVAVEEAPGAVVPVTATVAGDLSGWTATAPGKTLVIDPERGRFLFLNGPPAAGSTVSYYYGFSGEIGAGAYSRLDVEERPPDVSHPDPGPITAVQLQNDGVLQIEDSGTYGPVANKLAVNDMVVQAANQQRPYVRLESDWILNTGANANARLLLDGLWLGAGGSFSVVLRGDYESVAIRHATFDPGGHDVDDNPIPPLPLVIEGHVERLVIDHAIMGPITVAAGGVLECLQINDSIVDGAPAGAAPLALPRTEVELTRVTVFGEVDVNRLWATETLITGAVDVTDTQNGCFRFSAAPAGSRLPRPYESHEFDDPGHFFTSRRFGDPGYAQLSLTAPVTLVRGAENGSEMGAFNALLNPIRLDSLQAKVDEFLPFGLIPIYIVET